MQAENVTIRHNPPNLDADHPSTGVNFARRSTVEVEIWPTSIVLPKGYRLMLTVQGRDFELPGLPGRMLHTHPEDRPAGEFGGTDTILTGGAHASYLLMPHIQG